MDLPRASLTRIEKACLTRNKGGHLKLLLKLLCSVFTMIERESFSQRQTAKFKQEKKQLQRLVEVTKCGSDQLVCLLQGPGGCGKTTVIDLVVAYSKEYCCHMENYEFENKCCHSHDRCSSNFASGRDNTFCIVSEPEETH